MEHGLGCGSAVKGLLRMYKVLSLIIGWREIEMGEREGWDGWITK